MSHKDSSREKRRMATSTKHKSINVLVVEDNEIYANFIREALHAGDMADFEVDVAKRLEEAISEAKQNEYHVILLDLGLPDSQGVETATSLRSHVKETPVVILTGQDDVSLALEALSRGDAWNYLSKNETDIRKLEIAVEDAAL